MLCLSGSDSYREANYTTHHMAQNACFPGRSPATAAHLSRSLKLYLITRSIFQMPGAPANVGEFSGAEFLRL